MALGPRGIRPSRPCDGFDQAGNPSSYSSSRGALFFPHFLKRQPRNTTAGSSTITRRTLTKLARMQIKTTATAVIGKIGQ